MVGKVASMMCQRGFSGADIKKVLRRCNQEMNAKLVLLLQEKGSEDLITDEDLLIDTELFEDKINTIQPLNK